MFGLRQEVGSNKLGIAVLVGNDAHLGWSGRHVDGNIVKAHLLFGSHHILVSRTKNLVNLWNTLSAVSHCSDSLHTTSFEYLAHSSYLCSSENGWMHFALFVWRGAQHNLFAACNLSRCGKHQNSREQRCCSARDIQSYFLYSNSLLPACNTLAGYNFFAFKLL